MNYVAPWWLPCGNLQTIWAALRSRRFLGPPPVFRRERWSTPDNDFVAVDWLMPASSATTASLGNSAVREAASVGARFTAAPPQGETAPSGGSAVREATSVGAPPLLVIFHGLEGSSASHYAEAFADVARTHGWACAVPHFRGCSGEP
ncbi:MAG: alpha/beta hydrolase, partial [Polaromonas sp.]